jgi:hypothetical protein
MKRNAATMKGSRVSFIHVYEELLPISLKKKLVFEGGQSTRIHGMNRCKDEKKCSNYERKPYELHPHA